MRSSPLRARGGPFLDGEGVFDAPFGECANDLVTHSELGNEIWGWVVSAVMVLAMCLPVSFSVISTCCIHARTSPTVGML